MSRALVLQHSDPFGPGRLIPILSDYGIPIEIRRLWQGDEVSPADLDELRVLIVLGGAEPSIRDLSDPARPYLAAEVQLLQRVIARDRAVLGIGLGAQLLAHAAGAKVYPNAKPAAKPDEPPAPPPAPLPEYGWAGVTFPFPGGTEPLVYGLIDGTPMFHWHTDTFDLPKLPAPPIPAPPPAPPPPSGNALLSSSRACRNQAFRFKTRLFGFQYHFQLSNEEFEKIFSNETAAIAQHLGPESLLKLRDETARNYGRYARAGDRLVNNFVQYLKAY